MAKENSPANKGHLSPVVSVGPGSCKAEGCKSKGLRAEFCNEHYGWFKEGLITLEGFHSKDFEKKYLQYLARKEKAAA